MIQIANAFDAFVIVLAVAVAMFVMRTSIVSLNKDMRLILDRQADMRGRLEALEKRP